MVFKPDASVTEQLNDPLWTMAGAPLQMTAEMPDRASETVPVTDAEDEVNVAPFAGEVMLTLGGVLSKLTEADVEAELPAKSVTVPLTA
jgi:hypothetical protein